MVERIYEKWMTDTNLLLSPTPEFFPPFGMINSVEIIKGERQ